MCAPPHPQVFNFDVISIVPLDCIFRYNFLSAFFVRTLMPLFVVALLLVAGRRAARRGKEGTSYLLTNGGVLLIFLCYPGITQTVFKFFQVQNFDGKYGTYLMADYSIDADGDAYKAVTPYAVAMIFVWPFGVPFLIGVLLLRTRTALLEIRRRERQMGIVYSGELWAAHVEQQRQLGLIDPRDEDEPAVEGYLWSLTESYRGSVFYFEVLEYVLQKLVLVGLLVFYEPGSLSQLTLGLVVCFVYFGFCCYLLPFGNKTDNLMVCVTQFSLFIAMLSAVVVEHGSTEVPAFVVLVLSVAAVTPAVLGLVLSVQAVFNEMGIDPLRVFKSKVMVRHSPGESIVMKSSAAAITAAPADAAGIDELSALSAQLRAVEQAREVEKRAKEAAEEAIKRLEERLKAVQEGRTESAEKKDLSDRLKALFSPNTADKTTADKNLDA